MKEFFKVILYQPFYNILIFLTWLIPGHNIGWSIIALTVLVRIALMPSSAKATRAQKDMKKLAPELAEIKKKFAGDRQGEAAATMELYKKHGVSPWGSCLPLLIQLPILWILYKVFMVGLNTDRFDLLYKFTPYPDHINTIWLGINLAQPDKWILPILAGLAQLLQSWQMKQLNPTPPKTDPDSKNKAADFSQMLSSQMLYIMPVFTVIIAMRLPAALALYWLITTLFMVVQTWWIMKKSTNDQAPNPKQISNSKPQIKEEKKEEQKEELKVEEKKEPRREGIMDRLANRASRYKPRKDVTVEVRKKE